MQTIGDTAPVGDAEHGRPVLAFGLVALAFVMAAFVLALARGDALPTDPQRWTPLQMAERFNALYETGRVEDFQGLVSPDAEWCLDVDCAQVTPFFGSAYLHENQTAGESQYLAATGGTLGAECWAHGIEVECTWHQSNIFFDVAGIEPWVGTQLFTVEGGMITRYTGGYRYEGVFVYDRVQQNEYSDWLAINHPAEHETLFEDQLMLVFTEEARNRHRELTAEWAANF